MASQLNIPYLGITGKWKIFPFWGCRHATVIARQQFEQARPVIGQHDIRPAPWRSGNTAGASRASPVMRPARGRSSGWPGAAHYLWPRSGDARQADGYNAALARISSHFRDLPHEHSDALTHLRRGFDPDVGWSSATGGCRRKGRPARHLFHRCRRRGGDAAGHPHGRIAAGRLGFRRCHESRPQSHP
jgi:hypothetical protein